MFDGIIIGGGPAGVSAALTMRRRNKSCLILAGAIEDNPLYRAAEMDNYPGLPHVSGADFLRLLEEHAVSAGAELLRGRVTSVLPLGESFGVAVGQDFYEGRSVILCTGLSRGKDFPGESELLGRGVSYCVTCDGMLYRGRKTALLGFTAEAEHEAQLLRDMGCEVELFTDRKSRYAVVGEERVRALSVDGEEHPCEAVFILRPAVRPDRLIDGLEMNGVHVSVDRHMASSIPGFFAAGDCTGAPYQAAKAVGEGNVAALSACEYLEAGAAAR